MRQDDRNELVFTMKKKSAVIVDDDPIFTTLIALHLRKEGFSCTVFNEACQAKLRIDPNNSPDIFILDYDLRSDLTGLDLCRMITSGSTGAVIMMTVNDTEEAVVSCLDAGAAHYIVKPYKPMELIARIRSTLRRKNDEKKSKKTGQSLLDSHARRLLNGKASIPLTEMETALMEILLCNLEKRLSREQAHYALYGKNREFNNRAIDVLVSRLRRKLEQTHSPYLINNIRSFGYVLTQANQ